MHVRFFIQIFFEILGSFVTMYQRVNAKWFHLLFNSIIFRTLMLSTPLDILKWFYVMMAEEVHM